MHYSSSGYKMVKRPGWYEGKTFYIPEHHLAYCQHHDLTHVPKGMRMHHIDGCNTNNEPGNLTLLTPAEYNKMCDEERRLKRLARPLTTTRFRE